MDKKSEIPEARSASPPQETVPDLKALREAGGLSLGDVFEKTRVTLSNLSAVESGEFNRLPPPVYARNFIRKYARAVGIDEKPILNRYETYLKGLHPAIEEAEVQKPWPETGGRNRFLIGSLAAVILVGVLVSVLFLYDKAEQPAPPPPAAIDSTSPAPAIPGPAPAAPVPDSSAQAAMAGSVAASPVEVIRPPAEAGKLYNLVIEAQERTWLRITADRSQPYEALLNPGDKIERTASDHFQLDIGNAGGIHLTFQGKPLGSPGKSGQVVHMRLPEKESGEKSP